MKTTSSRPIIASAILLTAACATAHAATLSISDSPSPNTFPLVAANQTADIRIDPKDAKVVQIAANLLAEPGRGQAQLYGVPPFRPAA